MHYYQYNISDYLSHTQHLTELEDLAFRRMLDLYYLHESPLPLDPKEIAKLIRMRTHCDCIANVLLEFFDLQNDGHHNTRADKEIESYQDKSEKARQSAKARWDKKSNKNNSVSSDNANALRPKSERNAKHKTLNNNQEPLNSSTHTHITNINLSDSMAKNAMQYWEEKDIILDVSDVFDRFKAHHKTKETTSADWDASWQIWYMDKLTLDRGH